MQFKVKYIFKMSHLILFNFTFVQFKVKRWDWNQQNLTTKYNYPKASGLEVDLHKENNVSA